jgi:hypothetical protein
MGTEKITCRGFSDGSFIPCHLPRCTLWNQILDLPIRYRERKYGETNHSAMEARAVAAPDGTADVPKDSFCLEPIDKTLHRLKWRRLRPNFCWRYPRVKSFAKSGFAAGPCIRKDTLQLSAIPGNNIFLGHSAMLVNEGSPIMSGAPQAPYRDLRLSGEKVVVDAWGPWRPAANCNRGTSRIVKVLVNGPSGFICGYLIQELLEK